MHRHSRRPHTQFGKVGRQADDAGRADPTVRPPWKKSGRSSACDPSSGGYRVSHGRRGATVGNEAPVWHSPTPSNATTTSSATSQSDQHHHAHLRLVTRFLPAGMPRVHIGVDDYDRHFGLAPMTLRAVPCRRKMAGGTVRDVVFSMVAVEAAG